MRNRLADHDNTSTRDPVIQQSLALREGRNTECQEKLRNPCQRVRRKVRGKGTIGQLMYRGLK